MDIFFTSEYIVVRVCLGGKDMEEIFSDYYKYNSWGSKESKSGPGSTLYESKQLIEQLPELLKTLNIKTILDAACGDFNWMKEINLSNYLYTGIDIVTECIIDNQKKYQKDNIKFLRKSIMIDPLPTADIIICRDALVHFPSDMVLKTIQNFKDSGSTYLLMTHFTNIETNSDINMGDWRPINFTLEPFNFKEPLYIIKETLPIKTMALWKLNDL